MERSRRWHLCVDLLRRHIERSAAFKTHGTPVGANSEDWEEWIRWRQSWEETIRAVMAKS